MSSIGLNVDRSGRHEPAWIRATGATWLRIVALPGLDLSDYFKRCRAAGLKILLVLARESGGNYAEFQRLYGTLVDAIQVGNESDLESESSWTMTQGQLMALGKAARQAFPHMPLVCAGLASGHPEWLDGADLSWADAVSCHPYAKDSPDPDDLEDQPDADVLIRAYQRFGLPVLVTEWGWPSDQQPRAADEVRGMIRYAARTGDCEVFFYFAADDLMVPPFGLYDAQGKAKPQAAAFKSEAQNAVHSLWPSVVTPPVEPAPPAKPGPWQFFAAEQIASASGCPLAAVRENWPRLHEQLTHCKINDRPTQLAMIGTVAIETASTFRPIHEFGTPADWAGYEGGAAYAGRGFIQITHRSNYARYGPKIAELWNTSPDQPDFDLVGDPDRALDPDISAAIAALYFRDHGVTGGELIPKAARRGDWAEVRRLVWGANPLQYPIGHPGRDAYERMFRIVNDLGTAAPPPTADPRDEKIAAYEIALRTLRDVTLPAIEARLAGAEAQLDAAQTELDEARRIAAQFAPA